MPFRATAGELEWPPSLGAGSDTRPYVAAYAGRDDSPTREAGMTPPYGPVDPFADDPDDPARALDDDEPAAVPIAPDDREQVLGDLEDLELFEALLAPRGVRGLAVGCDDCGVAHYIEWDLLRSNLRQLLDAGTARVHEPAVEPDTSAYVSWDYARGFTDACLADDAES